MVVSDRESLHRPNPPRREAVNSGDLSVCGPKTFSKSLFSVWTFWSQEEEESELIRISGDVGWWVQSLTFILAPDQPYVLII